jgi:FKBP-type peptidyl-prolyl cis-trans isomerase 2
MKKGDFVRVNYVGRLESGEIFDLTDEAMAKKEGVHNQKVKYKPIPIIIGEKFLIKGLEDSVIKMKIGEKINVEIKPQDGFGERNAGLVKIIPRKVFKNERVDPKPGMIVDFAGTKGRIQSVDAGRIRVDFNNPLAGKTLKYDLELVEVIEGVENKIKSIFEFFGIEKLEMKIEGDKVTIEMMLPEQIKKKISSLILDNIPEVKNVNFVETFKKDVK